MSYLTLGKKNITNITVKATSNLLDLLDVALLIFFLLFPVHTIVVSLLFADLDVKHTFLMLSWSTRII
jgi:hypothetical protein